MISRFGAASGSGDDDYDYDDERKASPARGPARGGASAPVDFRPVGGVASPETTLDLPPESPVGKAKASASPAKLGQSRSARSLLWSSVESVGLGGDQRRRSWRSSSERGHRSAVGAAAASSAKRGATRQKINSASAAHRQQRVKEFQVLQGAASPRAAHGALPAQRRGLRRAAPASPSPMAARYDVDPPGGVHEVLGSAIVGDDDDWGETRDPGGGGFGDWPPASPLGHFHRPPSRQKGAFPTHLMAGDGARRDLDEDLDIRDEAGASDGAPEPVWKSNLQPDFNAERDEPRREPVADARRAGVRARLRAAPPRRRGLQGRGREPGRRRVVFEGDETKKTLRRPPSRQKMPKAALFGHRHAQDARQLPLGPATFRAPKAQASGRRGCGRRCRAGPASPSASPTAPDLAPKVADVADEPAPRGRKPSISQVDAPAAPPAVAPPAAYESRAPRAEDDVDRHHDPEADGFTAIDEPTPCPFRIQVTQNDGRSTVLLDDGARPRRAPPAAAASAAAKSARRRPGARPCTRTAPPAFEDLDDAPASAAAPPRTPTAKASDWEPAAGVAAGPRRGGGPPRAAAAVRGRGPPRVRGRQRPQSAIPSTYKHAALHGATPRHLPRGAHGAAPAQGVGQGRRGHRRLRFLGKEELKRRLVADQAGLGGKGPLTLKRSPKPVVERSTSSPAVAAEPEAAPPADAFGGLELAAPGSGDSLGSDEDDLLEVASGSSFNDDDDNQLGAQMLETNLGEEFLSLFAPITH
ncbi:hypothetical protein JL721_12450 [Aureococcus anophagefferens]|nr:hypothetical protein JL721_12450 [Aureococcus anophagefferens]